MCARAILSAGFLLVLLAAVTALGEPGGGEPAPGGSPATTATLPVVELLDQGKGPLTTLRFCPAVGERRMLKITQYMKQGMAFGDMPLRMRDLPTVLLPFRIEVKEIRANGDVLITFQCGKVEVAPTAGSDPVDLEIMKVVFVGVEGVGGTALLNNRGMALLSRVEIPENMHPQAKVVLENSAGTFSFPLPEQPVGVGARWTVASPVKTPNALPEHVTTFTLRSLEGTKFDVLSEAKTNLGEAEIQMVPGQPILRRLSLIGTGTTKSLGDLKSCGPDQSEVESTIEERIVVKEGVVVLLKTICRTEVRRAE